MMHVCSILSRPAYRTERGSPDSEEVRDDLRARFMGRRLAAVAASAPSTGVLAERFAAASLTLTPPLR